MVDGTKERRLADGRCGQSEAVDGYLSAKRTFDDVLLQIARSHELIADSQKLLARLERLMSDQRSGGQNS